MDEKGDRGSGGGEDVPPDPDQAAAEDRREGLLGHKETRAVASRAEELNREHGRKQHQCDQITRDETERETR